MANARRVWRVLGVLWVVAGAALSILMLFLAVATLVDLGWQGRAIGAFAVAGVAIAMTVLGAWTIRAEFLADAARTPPTRARPDRR